MKRLILSICILAAMAGAAMATGAYDIKEMTPPVKAALEGRKSRYADLKEFKKQGIVGENNRGYVTAIGAAAGVSKLVEAENADRKAIYQAIIEQNELTGNALATVEQVFAKVQRDKAEPGEKIQDEDGKWSAK